MVPTTDTTAKQNGFPRLRENIWHVVPDRDKAVLFTTGASFHIEASSALRFLQMRSYCTGHHSVADIARRSGLPEDEVRAILDGLGEAGVLLPKAEPVERYPIAHVRDVLVKICELWSRELALGYIGNEFVAGDLPEQTLVGWLLEMYHYIRDFPHAISHAAARAEGRLGEVLARYANEELGHEEFVLKTLVNLGLSRREVETSAPLLSTRLIGILMRQLFTIEPSAVLLVAALVEAQEFDEEQIARFKLSLHDRYGIDERALDPYFRHQAIDVGLGHARLLADNIELIEVDQPDELDRIVDKLHDIKHAFDLQGMEIKRYFNALDGKYLPRQPMRFSSL